MIKIWDVYAEKHVRILKGHKDGVKCLKLLPSFKLASGSLDSSIIIWNYNTSECIQIINGHSNSILGLEFIPNDHLISCSTDNFLKVFFSFNDKNYSIKQIKTNHRNKHVFKLFKGMEFI